MSKRLFKNWFYASALAATAVFSTCLLAPSQASADAGTSNVRKVAFYGNVGDAGDKIKPAQERSQARYPKPGFAGQSGSLPRISYKGMTLVGSGVSTAGFLSDKAFFAKIRDAIDLIEGKAPAIFSLMRAVNSSGHRVIYYTGKIGPASFTYWDGDYVVNISATSIDEDPAFENTIYSLAATLVHEMAGHGRQEADGRLWPMYDWCGRDSVDVEGVVWQANHKGSSSGFVEYEANLFARWFLESVRGTYPDLNEPAVRRYVKTVRLIKGRFPGWYDERKTAVTLLKEFEGHFKNVCPGLPFTPHPAAGS